VKSRIYFSASDVIVDIKN